jgi:hypothetical protein
MCNFQSINKLRRTRLERAAVWSFSSVSISLGDVNFSSVLTNSFASNVERLHGKNVQSRRSKMQSTHHLCNFFAESSGDEKSEARTPSLTVCIAVGGTPRVNSSRWPVVVDIEHELESSSPYALPAKDIRLNESSVVSALLLFPADAIVFTDRRNRCVRRRLVANSCERRARSASELMPPPFIFDGVSSTDSFNCSALSSRSANS